MVTHGHLADSPLSLLQGVDFRLQFYKYLLDAKIGKAVTVV
jgi:hypothetical protein